MKKRKTIYAVLVIAAISVYLVFTRPQYFISDTDKFFGLDNDYNIKAEKTPAKEAFTVKFLSLQAYMNTTDMEKLCDELSAYSYSKNKQTANPFDSEEKLLKTEQAVSILSESDLSENLLSDKTAVVVEKYKFSTVRKTMSLLSSYAVYCAQKYDYKKSSSLLHQAGFIALCADRGYGIKPTLVDSMIAKASYKKIYDSLHTIISSTKATGDSGFNSAALNVLNLIQKNRLSLKDSVSGEQYCVNKAFPEIYSNKLVIMTLFDICNNPFSTTQKVYNKHMNYYTEIFSETPVNMSKLSEYEKNISHSNYLVAYITPIMKSFVEKTYEENIQNILLTSYLSGSDTQDPLNNQPFLRMNDGSKSLIYSKGLNGIDEKGEGDDIGYVFSI